MSRHKKYLLDQITKLLLDTIILFAWGFCVWATRVVVINNLLINAGANQFLAELSHAIFMVGFLVKSVLNIVKDIRDVFQPPNKRRSKRNNSTK